MTHESDERTVELIESISKQRQRHEELRPEWRFHSEDVPLANPRFGWVQHVAVLGDDQNIRYDQPIVTCRPGPVCIAVDAQGKIALLRHFRPIVLDLDAPPEYPITSFDKLGVESLEFPRGGANPDEKIEQAAAREVEEEVGYRVLSVRVLDRCNADTAFFPISAVTCLVTVDRSEASKATPDPLEDTDVAFVGENELISLIADGKVLCSQTKAAFLSYLIMKSKNVAFKTSHGID